MNRVALITGGQQGIGFGIASALSNVGYVIALASERAPDDENVVEALSALGGKAAYFQHDLTAADGTPAFLDLVETTLGPVTTLVSNAGVPARRRGDMLEIPPENFDFVMDVNLRGAYFLVQETAKRMLARTSDCYRSITLVTSVSAEMVSVERAEYCISKAGASMMAKLFAVRLARDGIGVFELRPGIIETALTADVKDKYTVRIEDGLVPAARWGYPEDIGSIVVPLAEGQLAFATGAVIPVDGGLAIPRL